MKKVVSPTGFARLEGFAEKDGVTICPYLGIFPEFSTGPAVRATVDENGLTSCKTVKEVTEFNQLKDKIQKLQKRALIIGAVGAVLMLILTLVFALTEGSMYQVTFTLLYVMIAAMIMSDSVGIFFARLFGDKEIKNYSKFLGAKNAVINAFNDTDRVPNQEEIREYSTFSGDTRSQKGCYLATIFLAFSVLRFLPLPIYFVTAIALIAVLMGFEKKHILSFWQALIVSNPDDVHYNAAIEAMREAIKYYDDIRFRLGIVVTVEVDPKELEIALENCKKCAEYDSCEERERREKLFADLKKETVDEAAEETADESANNEEAGEENVETPVDPEKAQPVAGDGPTEESVTGEGDEAK